MREREREREREKKKKKTALIRLIRKLKIAGQEAEKVDKCSQDVKLEEEVAQAAYNVVAGDIGGSNNDPD